MTSITAIKAWGSSLFSRKSLREDAMAGLVLGVESVPDGLAAGVLAGVNPIYGLYAYMTGVAGAALFTSATYMAVQGTGAMAVVISDVPAVHSGEQPGRALFMLAILTGVVMLLAGFLKLGRMLRWVSQSVMVGFMNAVGVNVILGQFSNFTGYEADGANRITRALNTVFNPGSIDWRTVLIGAATVALIVILERTRLGPLGLVAAIVVTSATVPLLGWEVAQLRDIATVPGLLPAPVLPDFGAIPDLLVPAFALAFVALVQGAGISSAFPNPDGQYPNHSQDFIGQGAANIASGVFQGMPVGGSTSASALIKTAGAKTKAAHLIAGMTMAIVILTLGDGIGYIAMPALAGLLMIVGYRTIKPEEIKAGWRIGRTSAVVMAVTFALTMLIPLHNAVLVGIGLSVILYVFNQSNKVTVKRWLVSDDGRLREVDPPESVEANEVVILQPYGSLFFASAPVFEESLPEVTSNSNNAIVIIRLRGKTDLGSTFMEVIHRYASSLLESGSQLWLVYAHPRVRDQLAVSGVAELIGSDHIYESDEWLGATLLRAHADALKTIDMRAET